MRSSRLWAMALVLVLFVSACAQSEAIPTPVRWQPPTSTPTPRVTATPTSTAVPPAPKTGVAKAALNVREGPGTDFPRVDGLTQGYRCEIVDQNEDGSWYKVKLESGTLGWVAASYMDVELAGE